jgi:predicted homoserine dehydrogenase-like protein
MAALPIGLSEGRVLRRDVAKDEVLSFDHVDAIPGGMVEKLWHEQNARWPVVKQGSQESSLQPLPTAGVR